MLRQRCSRLVRKTLSFSKKLVNHISVEVHNRKAPKSVRKAVTLRTGIAGSRQLGSADVTEILVQQILLTLLDSPAQLKR